MSSVIDVCERYNDELFETAGNTLRWTLRTKLDRKLVQRALDAIVDHTNVVYEYEMSSCVSDNEFDRSYNRAQKALNSVKKRLEAIFSKIAPALHTSLDEAANDCIDVDDKGHGVLDADPTEVAVYVMNNDPAVETLRIKNYINVESMSCLIARWQKNNASKK